MKNTENNVAAQAGDEPMRTLDERRAEHELEAVRINAGRKPKFGDWMRNPWAGESNPQRDGMFVQSKRVTGKFNPGLWYEMTNGEGEFWSSNGKVLFFIDSPRATADVERAAKDDRISMPTNALQAEGMMKLGLAWLQHNAPEQLTNAGRATADVKDAARYRYLRDHHIGDDPESINLDAAKRPGLDAAIDAAIATTKPGA